MKSFITLCFTVLLGGALFAQMPKDVPDAKAKAILDELSKKTKGYTTIKAEFTMVTTDPKGKTTDNTTGTMLHKGDKFKLSIKGQVIFCDAKTQWTYNKDDQETLVQCPPDAKKGDNINPSNIFTIYEKGFKYKFEKEEVQNGVTVEIVNLYPLEPGKKPYHTVKLTIDKAKNQIISVKIMNKDGNTTTITVKSFTPNSDMPDPTFVYKESDYPGVTVTDLRDGNCN
jgi:outer membrane lipoprotein-sorting protein